MEYTQSQFQSISYNAIEIFNKRLNNAFYQGALDDFLKDYNIEINKCDIVFNNKSKILVLGSLAGKKKDYIIRAKKLGISENCLEFVDVYDDKFNAANLEYSDKYTDIILGPMPHKLKGLEKYSSFIAQIQHNQEKYARAIDIRDYCDNLKITITSFTRALKETRFYENL